MSKECKLSVDKLPFAEPSGDWHDQPLKWMVNGPGKECQKFSTKSDAQKYAVIRNASADQKSAIETFVQGVK